MVFANISCPGHEVKKYLVCLRQRCFKLDAVVGVYEGMKNWHSGGQEKVTSIEFSKNVKKTVQKQENTSIELYYSKDMI